VIGILHGLLIQHVVHALYLRLPQRSQDYR
jgi:hypothetical protein